ncbi:M protein [Pseudomonas chlororaphis subsp. aurantiaca]|uniref:hypothetical protein n=1 Tax=Pseudomonas chlororaphis TaxID=587753 RepID=UPI000865E54B|nr:hypothetical protein [Pseudomonas chlororaphis]BAV77761.1 M protein [Pseudomonas chlororaphis subsp. aurantiaca]
MTVRTTQKSKLDSQLAVLEHRVNELEDRHETVPTRVTLLEGQFQHMSGQLSALNEGQRELTATVSDIGGKVTRLLAVLTVLGIAVQMIAPAVLRVLFP